MRTDDVNFLTSDSTPYGPIGCRDFIVNEKSVVCKVVIKKIEGSVDFRKKRRSFYGFGESEICGCLDKHIE